MKKLTLFFALALFTLPAMAHVPPAEDLIFRTHQVDDKVFTVLLANLQQENAFLTIHQLDGSRIYTKAIKNHNGFNQKFNFNLLKPGRYVLRIQYQGETKAVVIYLDDEDLTLSSISTE